MSLTEAIREVRKVENEQFNDRVIADIERKTNSFKERYRMFGEANLAMETYKFGAMLQRWLDDPNCV